MPCRRAFPLVSRTLLVSRSVRRRGRFPLVSQLRQAQFLSAHPENGFVAGGRRIPIPGRVVRGRTDGHIPNDIVHHDERRALRTAQQAVLPGPRVGQFQATGARQGARRIAHHLKQRFAFQLLVLEPGGHDGAVIHRDNQNLVDPGRAHGRLVLEIAGDLNIGAAVRRRRRWDGTSTRSVRRPAIQW
jgi:hypothetical protein